MIERSGEPGEPVDGAILFARYAYAPNALGLCGPAESRALLESCSSGVTDGGLRRLAQGFEGAWPSLQLIARANTIEDPLDFRVVEAYWLGNQLLDRIPRAMLGAFLDDRCRRTLGGDWRHLLEVVEAGARPDHNFHVLAVYPWIGLLRDGNHGVPLHVLDRCRIRWGEVQSVTGDEAIVVGQGLSWDRGVLSLGPARSETVTWRRDGLTLGATLIPGMEVSMHWDWVCDVLGTAQVHALHDHTARQLQLVNNHVPQPVTPSPDAAIVAR